MSFLKKRKLKILQARNIKKDTYFPKVKIFEIRYDN